MKTFIKRSISLLLVAVMLFGSVPIFQMLGVESLEKFNWSTINASAASAITMTTGDDDFYDDATWLDIDSDRVSWTCSTTSVKSFRYTVREMAKGGVETSNVLVNRKLTTSKYFKLSSLSGINAATCYKVWVGAFTDTSGNTELQGDPGCVVYIRTMSEAPTVSSGKASSIGATYATLSGTIEKNGGESITECGFVVSTSKSNLTTSKGTVFKLDKTGDIKGTFSKKVTDLSPLAIHTYYFKFYAKNSEGTSYGDAVSFKLVCPHTNKDDKIVIETLSYKSISETQHERSAYYDEYCTLCCATLRYEYRHDTIKENHDYNAAGICLDCKHAKACPHEEQSKEYYTETYSCIDETYHYYNHFCLAISSAQKNKS